MDRVSKATLPLTMPCHMYKSSAKDSTYCLIGITLKVGPPNAFVGEIAPPTQGHGKHEGSFYETTIER